MFRTNLKIFIGIQKEKKNIFGTKHGKIQNVWHVIKKVTDMKRSRKCEP